MPNISPNRQKSLESFSISFNLSQKLTKIHVFCLSVLIRTKMVQNAPLCNVQSRIIIFSYFECLGCLLWGLEGLSPCQLLLFKSILAWCDIYISLFWEVCLSGCIQTGMYCLKHWKYRTPMGANCKYSISFKNGKNTSNTLKILFKYDNSQLFIIVININQIFNVELFFKKAKYLMLFGINFHNLVTLWLGQ